MKKELPGPVYVLKRMPANRQQKRISQKELEKVQRICLPIVITFMEDEKKNDDTRKIAHDHFIKMCRQANRGNVYIFANDQFFDKHFPTKERLKEQITPPAKQKIPAYFIIAFLLIIAALCYFLK